MGGVKMDKIYLTSIRFFKILKKLILSMLGYCDLFIQHKKNIDNMYIEINKKRNKEIQTLNIALKDIQRRNSNLEKEIMNIRSSIDKKRKLIENLQDLITRRSD